MEIEPFLKSVNRLEWFDELNDLETLLENETALNLYKEKFEILWRENTAKEWEDKLGDIGVPGSVSRTINEWIDEEQSYLSESIINVEDPYFGKMKQPGKLIQNL